MYCRRSLWANPAWKAWLIFAPLCFGLAACASSDEPIAEARPDQAVASGGAASAPVAEAPLREAVFKPFEIKDLTPPVAQVAQPKDKKAKDKKKKNDEKSVPAGWHLDYDQALAQAKSTGKPLLVLFH